MRWLEQVTIEPFLFLYTTGLTLSELAQQTLVAEKMCRVYVHYNNTVCDALSLRDLSHYSRADNNVQGIQSQYSSYGRLMQSVFPCFLAMTWGSWGDKHKRRIPPLLVAVLGELLKNLLIILCIFYTSASAQVTYLLIVMVPAITGGNIVVQMAATSYLADITTEEGRTHRIGLASVVLLLAFPVGYFSSGVVNKHLGFYGVFGLCSILNFVNIIYLTQCVKESFVVLKPPGDIEKSLGYWQLTRDFLSWSHMRSTIGFAFAKVGQRRHHVILFSLLVLFAFGPTYGEYDVVYFFVRRKYAWNLEEYSQYLSAASAIAMISLAVSTHFFSKVYPTEDAIMGMLASALKIVSCLVYALCESLLSFYLATIPDNFYVIAGVAVRSSITKLVKDEEQGKMNAFAGGVEALVFCMSSAFYASIYTETLTYFPGAFYLISVVLAVLALAGFGYQLTMSRKTMEGADSNKSEANDVGNGIEDLMAIEMDQVVGVI